MYQVYSLQRPGNPRRAIWACAALLAVTLSLAGLLLQAKARARQVDLETTSQVYPAGRLRCRLPQGWTRDADPNLKNIPGYVVAAQPGGDDERLVLLFRWVPQPLGLPTGEGLQVLGQVASLFRQLTRQSQAIATNITKGDRIGPLPACTVELATHTAQPNPVPSYQLGRVAVAPDGQIVGMLMQTLGSPGSEDYDLLDRLCEHLELTDIAPVEPEPAMRSAGILFDLPENVDFFAKTDSATANPYRLLMTGGQSDEQWYLDVARVPLIGQRTIAQVVEDAAANATEQFDPDLDIQTSTMGQKAVAGTRMSLHHGEQPSVGIWCAQTDAQTALLLIGRHESKGGDLLTGAAEKIIATAGVEPYDRFMDIAEAQKTAGRWIATLAREGLSSHYGKQASLDRKYLIKAPALPMKTETWICQSKQMDDGARWWDIAVGYTSASRALELPSTIQEKWSIRDDLSAHAGRYLNVTKAKGGFEYSELKPPSQSTLYCKRKTHEDETTEWQITLDESYACEPALMAAAARVARDRSNSPAIFTTDWHLSRHPHHWIVTPIGPSRLPDPESEDTALAVRVIRDFDPAPILLYFDQDDGLLAVSMDGLVWQQRIGVDSPRP